MNHQTAHVQLYRNLLESIAHYSKKALDLLQNGAGDLPQWANDILSATRTHIKDVTHFLRGQKRQGIRYGGLEAHGRAYMSEKNLREILEYAHESLSHLSRGAGFLPAWVENKISICAEYMDLIGHWLENELGEGRRYGTEEASNAFYLGRSHAIRGQRKNPYSPNDFRNSIYDHGFDAKPRVYGQSEYTPSKMEYMLPRNRMLEPNRMTELHRQLAHQTGRRFGVPGFAPGTPGWAGQAGVAQAPHPILGSQQFQNRPPQAYGSAGYASMGDGSMDMAVRGRRFSRAKSSKKIRPKTRRRNILK